MKPKITVDTSGLNRRIMQLQEALVGAGKTADAQNVIRNEARNLLKLLIKWTPPKNRKQGSDRVEKDVKRAAAFPLDEGFEVFRAPENAERVKGYLRSGSGRKKFETMLSRIKAYKGWTLKQFNAKTHKDARNAYGRVSRTQKVFIYNRAERERRIKYVAKRVGMMKAAWAKAFVHLGGKVPSWISRHLFGKVHGTVTDGLANPRNPYVVFTNSAYGIANKDAARRLPGALRVREKAIGRRIRLILSGYNEDIARGIRIRQRTRDKGSELVAE